ncbi:hypothetical protein NQ176_g4026 [Zarea fungicola]|uniref:Uncharacterized protein n=1 Tax=Zarea fungicola TaxID=93591 RepID=A0ACC1NGS9_9HYPO|nr:hypothetical protein NQ176_g4026 [Lecanicillium fungicola]
MATNDTSKKVYDLVLLTDATSSMSYFIDGLNRALPEIISLMALTSCFERIGVAAYRDMADARVTEWSGWYCSPSCSRQQEAVDQESLLRMAGRIVPTGGDDEPEAAKTGLAMVYSKMRPEATTLIILYTDALAHFSNPGGDNYKREIKKLTGTPSQFGPSDSTFVDWVRGAWLMRNGPKRGIVFPILARSRLTNFTSYTFLATVTSGNAFVLGDPSATQISQLSVALLLTWMRLGKTIKRNGTVIAGVLSYYSTKGIERVTSEDSPELSSYIAFGFSPPNKSPSLKNSTEGSVSMESLPGIVKARGPKMSSLSTAYTQDPQYKEMAMEQLRRIISHDVSIISVNPIFSSLWRTVCADRANQGRNELVTLFGQKVEKLTDNAEKRRMREWLDGSLDYEGEINEFLSGIPESQWYPQVYLDPTEIFADGTVENSGDEPNSTSVYSFTRPELLEIGRSCDYKILRRLGKALTCLRYAETAADVPIHIQAASLAKVPRIPMNLTAFESEHKFWNIILHLIVPGTKLADRAAALVAALSLRMGISPLRDAADRALLAQQYKWNTFLIPENWSTGCLSLLLQADEDYERRVADGTTQRPDPESRILSEVDRNIFKTLVDYKMLELNLDTVLHAKVAWQPYKNKAVLGPVVQCRQCNLPRSVSIMAKDSICGICVALSESRCPCRSCDGAGKIPDCLSTNVTPESNELTSVYWTECRVPYCRGQYVVYNNALHTGKSKCFYCRHKRQKFGSAPVVECRQCLSRIIWPRDYRPVDFDPDSYNCAACCSGHATVVDHETTARRIRAEIGSDWLVRNQGHVIPKLFAGQSIFALASSCDLESVSKKLSILPVVVTGLKFEINKRHVHNPMQVQDELRTWVTSRRVEAGYCGLCFSTAKKSGLQPACGRRGCQQRICDDCRRGWYGMNKQGCLINTAALSCPFCRRIPAQQTIRPFPIGSLAGLQRALNDNGSWIHAWCSRCDTVKEYVERVCAQGAPQELHGWTCPDCTFATAKDSTAKECPGCTTLTEKQGGCNHITCPCGTHWCYVCGQKSTAWDIYGHISLEHGGVAWDGFVRENLA